MKTLREIAVQLENKPGSLSQLSELLGANGINILALTVRTEGLTGTLNFVVPEPDRVVNILQAAGFSPSLREILAAEAPHHPGGLNALLKPLRRAGINVEYLYSFIGSHEAGDRTIILLGVDNPSAAYNALAEEWIQLYGEELFSFQSR